MQVYMLVWDSSWWCQILRNLYHWYSRTHNTYVYAYIPVLKHVIYLLTKSRKNCKARYGYAADTYLHTHTHTYIHTHIYVYIHTYIHTYMYMYMYMYIYIHTHKHMCVYLFSSISFTLRTRSSNLLSPAWIRCRYVSIFIDCQVKSTIPASILPSRSFRCGWKSVFATGATRPTTRSYSLSANASWWTRSCQSTVARMCACMCAWKQCFYGIVCVQSLWTRHVNQLWRECAHAWHYWSEFQCRYSPNQP